jgi:hypothetical protein
MCVSLTKLDQRAEQAFEGEIILIMNIWQIVIYGQSQK